MKPMQAAMNTRNLKPYNPICCKKSMKSFINRAVAAGSSLALFGLGVSATAIASERDDFAIECMQEAVKYASVERATNYCLCCYDLLAEGFNSDDVISFCLSRQRNNRKNNAATNIYDILQESIRQSGQLTRDMLNSNPYSGSTFRWSPP